MRLALEYAKIFGFKIISHAEDTALSSGGQINEGFLSTVLGLKGNPPLSEEIAVIRDVKLAEKFGPVHITHVSTAAAVKIIREAKKRGVPVTSDTCPHYFSLTEDAADGFNSLAKVNPPLRSQEDVKEIIAGLKDGTIDAISTDHAPHREEKKKVEFPAAAAGMVGFETALSLSLTVLGKDVPLVKIIEKLTLAPAKILGIPKGELKAGSSADITIVDPKAEYKINVGSFVSRSKNSPFDGFSVKGRAANVIVSGKTVVRDGKLI